MVCSSQHYFLMKTVRAAMIYTCSDDKVWYIHSWKVNDRASADNRTNNTAALSAEDGTLLLFCALPAKASAHRS